MAEEKGEKGEDEDTIGVSISLYYRSEQQNAKKRLSIKTYHNYILLLPRFMQEVAVRRASVMERAGQFCRTVISTRDAIAVV